MESQNQEAELELNKSHILVFAPKELDISACVPYEYNFKLSLFGDKETRYISGELVIMFRKYRWLCITYTSTSARTNLTQLPPLVGSSWGAYKMKSESGHVI